MINTTNTSPTQSHVVQGLTGIQLDLSRLDAEGFNIDDYTVAKILEDTEQFDYRLYQEFPYLYHQHGTIEDPDRLGMIINLIT